MRQVRMKRLLVDLCRLPDGHWVVRRYCFVAGATDLQTQHVVLPLEICSDGAWVVSGLLAIRFAAIFGFSPSDVDMRQFERIAMYLNALHINGYLPDIGHDGADIVPVAEEHAPLLDPLVALVKSACCQYFDVRLRDQISHAPSTSLAGGLCQQGEMELAFKFLQHCPRDLLPLALVPLYLDMGTSQNGESCFQYLDTTNDYDCDYPQWLFVCTHRKIYIDARGALCVNRVTFSDPHVPFEIAQRVLAIDSSDALKPEKSDYPQNVRIDRELERFFVKIKALVGRLSSARLQQMEEVGIVDPQQSCESMRVLVLAALRSNMRRDIKRLLSILFQRVYPFDGVPREAAYSQYFVGATITAVAQHRRERVQATMPFLSHSLRAGCFPKTLDSIDAGARFLPVLADELGVPRWAALRLVKLLHPSKAYVFFRIKGREIEHFALLGKFIAWLGPDCSVTRNPTEADRWLYIIDLFFSHSQENAVRRVFGRAADDVRLLIACVGREVNTPPSSEPDEIEWLRNLANDSLPTSLYFSVARATIHHHFGSNTIDIREVESILIAWLMRLTSNELMAKAKQVATLCWLHRREEMPRWLCEAMTETVEATIQAYTCAETGIHVVPLVSRAALLAEARRMHHCVGGYWDQVASGVVMLFSLYDSKSQLHATLSLRQRGKGSWAVCEFRGYENTDIRAPHFLLVAKHLSERLSSTTNTMNINAITGNARRKCSIASRSTDKPLPDLSIQSFPQHVQMSLVALYPGAGALRMRIEAASRKRSRYKWDR